ncbi:MAG: nicotinamide mononucleotide transporter [Bacteroidales bacterium]|nr:nicotinamide mononucleotide transporter [Bacteroidales bacterium]
MDIILIIEIIALVMGIPYMIFEVLQKNTMWYFGMVTSTACAIQFFLQSNWANMGLNIYYIGMAFWGLYQWKKDSQAVEAEIHLTRLTPKTAFWSALIFLVGTGLLVCVLHLLHDSNAWMDAVSTAMCVVAMVWLAKSIPYHWVLWVIADSILVVMCFLAGKYWMTLLYAAYVVVSSYGFFRWRKRGEYVS